MELLLDLSNPTTVLVWQFLAIPLLATGVNVAYLVFLRWTR